MGSAVDMRGVTKTFPGVVANNHVDFSAEKGEIHGLLGENGAGKTVLMSLLYGLYRLDEGEIIIDGDGPPTLHARPQPHCRGEHNSRPGAD